MTWLKNDQISCLISTYVCVDRFIKFNVNNIKRCQGITFCGNCGKRALDADKFCTNCGNPIIEAKLVVDEVGQIIKDEYKANQFSSIADSSLGSLSNQKRDVEWLEIIINDILKFADFKTTRQAYITLDEKGQNNFFVDILAIDFHLEIFVECKELKDLKTSEKILSDFIDQINQYRRSLGRRVIGILATTSNSDVYNTGIREKLKNENSFLWDDAFVDYLKNKMIEIKDKNEFRTYVLNHLDMTDISSIPNKDDIRFTVRYSFYTIHPADYIGGEFNVAQIIDNVENMLKGSSTRITNQIVEPVLADDGKTLTRYLVRLDFMRTIPKHEFQKLIANRGSLTIEDVYNEYLDGLHALLKKAYGVSYVSESIDPYETIYCEGGNAEYDSKLYSTLTSV